MNRYRYKIHDKVYDLTEFVKIHPGGQEMFKSLKPDTNITTLLYSYHKDPKRILELLPSYEIQETAVIQYDTPQTYDTYCELKDMVVHKMKEEGIPFYWSSQEIAYNAALMGLYIGLWIYCLVHGSDLSYGWMPLLVCIKLGYGALVFHETAHYTGFKNQTLNAYVSRFIMSPMINTAVWKYDHNYLHHSFTNTPFDGDFEANRLIIRQSSNQPHYIYHRLQYLYVHLVYLGAIFVKGPLVAILHQRWNILLFLGIVYQLGLVHTSILYGLSGLLFASIAQLSHIQQKCIEDSALKQDFLYNQVSSSMNWRTEDPFTRFLCFGLDLQIEHHLFPNIPHSSLRQVQPLVRAFCLQKGIPYLENPSVFTNLGSYVQYLYRMGNPN